MDKEIKNKEIKIAIITGIFSVAVAIIGTLAVTSLIQNHNEQSQRLTNQNVITVNINDEKITIDADEYQKLHDSYNKLQADYEDLENENNELKNKNKEYNNIHNENNIVPSLNIEFYVDGNQFAPKDISENIEKPFVFEKTIYLPLETIRELFDKNIEWDRESSIIYIGERINKPLKEVFLYDQPYLEVKVSNGFKATGDEKVNNIKIFAEQSDATKLADGRYLFYNYAVYSLNMKATKFTAVLNPPVCEYKSELVYKIYGDNNLLYTSPIFTPATKSQQMEVDISGFEKLKIEVEMTENTSHGLGLSDGWGWRGVENALVLTMDY